MSSTQHYPFIDYSTGGSIGGMIKAAEANVSAAADRTIVIPGHGNPVSNKTISAKPTAAFDAKWGQFVKLDCHCER